MFKKILIANRGEIAVRIAHTARKMGVRTVAVYSDADATAPHVRSCDEAVHIGPSSAAESYLRADKIIAAMKATGAEAVHPGYGFLSENASFAKALHADGLVFIGPTAATIDSMGSKSSAKDLMEAAGVPTTPGYQGSDQSVETFKREATRIGYPVLLKATAGGGGKGMRMVERESDLEEALRSAQREAKSAFGDDRFLIEKYIAHARHLEVQIFGDGHGNVVHMFERDCSIQRRHQKVIEEAPAPALSKEVRAKLLEAGVNAGKAVNYRGAGTVEFLYDCKDEVYFMEMNTRLQVEHPVSEMITGEDFVEWQLRIAAGESFPKEQAAITETGHAFEARLYAEDPQNNFAPSIGQLSTFRMPGGDARVDLGVEKNQTITPFYDPMIAKIITHGETRDEALGKMRHALCETRVAGLETNAAFLHALSSHPNFSSSDVSTSFIDVHAEKLFEVKQHDPLAWAVVALWNRNRGIRENDASPWKSLTAFRLNSAREEVFWIDHEGEPALLRIYPSSLTSFNARLEPGASAHARREEYIPIEPIEFSFKGTAGDDGEFRITYKGQDFTAFAAPHLRGLRIWIEAEHIDIRFPDPLSNEGGTQSVEGSLVAPMPGVVTVLCAQPGDEIEAGSPLIVMEAMKMEHTIKAPSSGKILSYKFQVGDQVKDGDLLVEFE